MKKEQFLDIVKRSMKKEATEQEMNFFGALGEAIEEAAKLDSVERNKEFEKIAGIVGTFDEGKTIAGVIRSLAQKVDDMEKRAQRGLSVDDKYKLRAMLEDKKDEIIRARNSKQHWEIEFKAKRAASAMMTTATVLTGAPAVNTMNVMDDLEILVIQYPRNFIIDAVGGRQVAKVPQTLKWKEQAAENAGVPTVVTEGSVKPLTDKSFVWKYATRNKYAGRIEFTEELAMDFDQLLLQIIDMFEQQVIRVWNAAIQTAIIAWAPAYTATGLDDFFANPGVAQVIQAGKLHVSDNNYDADIVMLNPVDAAKAMIHQNADGDIVYIPEAVALGGLTPFISNNIAAGTILVGSSNIIKEQHSPFILRRGVYGDQFIENEETIVGEVFSLLKLPTISVSSWVKLDIATVIAALTKAEV